MVIKFLNLQVNPNFAPIYAWFVSNSDFKSSSAFSIIFWSSGSIWEYVFSVCSMLVWPSRLDTATIDTPLWIRREAQLWRRSWTRIRLTFPNVHHEMRSHIAYSIETITLRHFLTRFCGKMLSLSGMNCVAGLPCTIALPEMIIRPRNRTPEGRSAWKNIFKKAKKSLDKWGWLWYNKQVRHGAMAKR